MDVSLCAALTKRLELIGLHRYPGCSSRSCGRTATSLTPVQMHPSEVQVEEEEVEEEEAAPAEEEVSGELLSSPDGAQFVPIKPRPVMGVGIGNVMAPIGPRS